MKAATSAPILMTKTSAVQEVEQQYGLPVVSIANLHDLLAMLADDATLQSYLVAVQAYRDKYGIN